MPKGMRGRKKGQTMEAKAYIEDSLLEPYKIKINEGSFDVFKGDEIQPYGYFTTLPGALHKVVMLKTTKAKSFTLKEFIDDYKASVDELTKMFMIKA